MALYEGLKQPRPGEDAAPPRGFRAAEAPRPRPSGAAAWRSLDVRVVKEQPAPAPFLDRLLGAGSGQTLRRMATAPLAHAQRTSPSPARPAPAKKEERVRAEPRMRVVGAGDETPVHGRQGVGRVLLVVLALAGTTAALRPWQREGLLKADWSALLRVPSAEDASAQAAQDASRQAQQSAADAAKLAALPLQAGTGKPLGLWQDGTGRWWRVDGGSVLAPCADPTAPENLGLPELRGVAAHAEAYRGGRRLLLDLPPGRLSELLPLRPGVASETQALELNDPSQPVLVTLDGTRCLMGDGDWGRRQKRLSLVLADLAARRRRAAQIDLRFEGTAVVRPLGR